MWHVESLLWFLCCVSVSNWLPTLKIWDISSKKKCISSFSWRIENSGYTGPWNHQLELSSSYPLGWACFPQSPPLPIELCHSYFTYFYSLLSSSSHLSLPPWGSTSFLFFSFLFVLISSTVRKEIFGSPSFAILRMTLSALFSELSVTQILQSSSLCPKKESP